MILQIDKRFTDPEIGTYGCHFLAELFLCNRAGNIDLSIGIIQAALNILRTQKASYQPDKTKTTYVIGEQITTNNPDDVVTYFKLTYSRAARFEPMAYQCNKAEQELIQYSRPGWWHWVAGDGKGNIAYDPEGYSRTVAEGKPVRKKIFTLVHQGVNA